MTILHPGELVKEIAYTGDCSGCGCKVSAAPNELRVFKRRQFDGEMESLDVVRCPMCGDDIFVDSEAK